MARKLYAYGMDGFVTPMMKYFVAEGTLPNFARMLRSGTVNQTYPSFPVWTPTNWATLSTGAHTGTHGYVSGYYAQWQEIVGGGAVGAPAVYGAHHGGFLPTDNGFSSTFGTMMLSGPGIKADYERPTEQLGYIQAVDVVPTYCHLLGIDPPAQSQGAVARDLWDGHEMVRKRTVE